MQTFIRRGTSYLFSSSTSVNHVSTAPEGKLFPAVDPAIDGEECLRDCESCTIQYPKKFHIDETFKLYGHVKGWATHLIVATGKSDWKRDVEDEKGSVMQAVGKAEKPENGRLMLSASNMPLPEPDPSTAAHTQPLDPSQVPTTVLLLPAFTMISNVTPESVPALIKDVISRAPTTTTPLPSIYSSSSSGSSPPGESKSSSIPLTPSSPDHHAFKMAPCPHRAIILLCSQKTRDARCGQSAPLLYREFARHLQPLGLYRDLQDERPGGVGIYFISHVGGHKFSANVMIYRRDGFDNAEPARRGNEGTTNGNTDGDEKGEKGEKEEEEVDNGATQCIWIARVRPEDCEGIVKYTVLQGKVVKPKRQLRGGFDRGKGLISW